ncbi:hypothetical protein EZS27_043205, partial [termite gut metagenome]
MKICFKILIGVGTICSLITCSSSSDNKPDEKDEIS